MAEVFAFAVSCKDVIPLNIEKDDKGVLNIEVPCGLAPDVYAVKLLWWKNDTRQHFPAMHESWFGRFFRHGFHVPDIHAGSRCVCMSYADGLFSVTNYKHEATHAGEPLIKVKEHVATYGYDGLSAYELAVLRGNTALSESEWLEQTQLGADAMKQIQNLKNIIKKYHPDADIDGDPIKTIAIIGLNDSYSVNSPVTIDRLRVVFNSGVKEYSGKLEIIDSDGVIIANTVNFNVEEITEIGQTFTPTKEDFYRIILKYKNLEGFEYEREIGTIIVNDKIVRDWYDAPSAYLTYADTEVADKAVEIAGKIMTRPTEFGMSQVKHTSYASGYTKDETITTPVNPTFKIGHGVGGSFVEGWSSKPFATFDANTGVVTFEANDGNARSITMRYEAFGEDGRKCYADVVITQKAASEDKPVGDPVYGVPTIQLTYNKTSVGYNSNLVAEVNKCELTQSKTIVYQSGKTETFEIHAKTDVVFSISAGQEYVESFDTATGKVTFKSNTSAERKVIISVAALGEDGTTATNSAVITQQAYTIPYYIGQVDGSSAAFAELSKEELISNAEAVRKVEDVRAVSKYIYYIMLPSNVTFISLEYGVGELKTTITALDKFKAQHVNVDIDGVAYKVYGYRVPPTGITYTLKVSIK